MALRGSLEGPQAPLNRALVGELPARLMELLDE
jgi:hypothetical protein